MPSKMQDSVVCIFNGFWQFISFYPNEYIHFTVEYTNKTIYLNNSRNANGLTVALKSLSKRVNTIVTLDTG